MSWDNGAVRAYRLREAPHPDQPWEKHHFELCRKVAGNKSALPAQKLYLAAFNVAESEMALLIECMAKCVPIPIDNANVVREAIFQQ